MGLGSGLGLRLGLGLGSIYLNELAAEQDPSGRMVFIFDLGCDKYERAAVEDNVEFKR